MKNIFKIKINNLPTELEIFKFSGGETQVKIINPSTSYEDCFVEIFALVREGDIMPLALIVDAIRQTISNPTINLHLPYLPYARQDRVMSKGESLGVKVFCNFVNNLNFNKITIDDCHSDVGTALLNNVNNDNTFNSELMSSYYNVLVAPDAGAIKKTNKYAKILNLPVVRADKERNIHTGEITGTVVYGDVVNKDVLIMDDICDGGKTFIELSKKLYEMKAKSVTLYVTHGIFSKGKEVLQQENIKILTKYDWTVL